MTFLGAILRYSFEFHSQYSFSKQVQHIFEMTTKSLEGWSIGMLSSHNKSSKKIIGVFTPLEFTVLI